MLFSNSIKRAGAIYREYPQQFWIVVGSNFIDRVGGALKFSFFRALHYKEIPGGHDGSWPFICPVLIR